MNPEYIDMAYKAGGVLLALGNIAFGYLLLRMRQEFVSKTEHKQAVERIDRHSERLNQGDARFQVLDERLRAVPTANDVNALALQLAEHRAEMKVLAERLVGFAEALNMIRSQVELMDQISRKLLQ